MESTDLSRHQSNEASRDLSSCQKELLQTRQYLQCILQNSNDMVFATDVDGNLVSFSSGGEKALGYRWEDVAGRKLREFAVDPLAFDKIESLSREKGSAARLEFPFQHREGQTIYCNISLIALTNTQSQIVGNVGICRDITQWKQLQEDLIRVDRLAEIGRTASGIAHEINNPIAVIGEIAGWVGAVAADADGLNEDDRKEIETAVGHIKEQTRRCRSITHQLLSFVRDSEPSRSSLDIHALIKETVSFLSPEFKYKEVEMILNLMDSGLTMNTDRQMLEQVLINLISNAVYAVKEKGQRGGRIEIETAQDETATEIRISDNGPGIPEEHQKRMYDLFFTTKPPGKGTGLGLPICQNIVRKLGGSLSFESEEGEGTTFFVRLPAS